MSSKAPYQYCFATFLGLNISKRGPYSTYSKSKDNCEHAMFSVM